MSFVGHAVYLPLVITDWALEALLPAPGYVATLAVEGHGLSLFTWQYA